MATLVLSAAGAAIGSSVGGTVLGLSSAVIGKAIGATIGSAIDQKILGSGSRSVETGRIDTFRLMSASEGAAIPQVYGQMRTAGQVIWSSRFLEKKSEETQGSKGNRTTVVRYSYSVSLAIALCEGEITKIGRIWADGNELALDATTWRLHTGREDQFPDPLIEAVEGSGQAPAYRGTAYIVFENLELAQFGNRIPQFNFEVVRRVKELGAEPSLDPFEELKAVALIPGTGEYALSTTSVRYPIDKGVSRSANHNNTTPDTDFVASLEQLKTDLPSVDSVSMVVSWFGDDLRCGSCRVQPCVEQKDTEGDAISWSVSGQNRSSAKMVSQTEESAVFGGTTSDASVLEGIAKLKSDGLAVMFYPFVLMDIPPGNTRVDPYSGEIGQPVYPWRGRITVDRAPGVSGSPDKSATAAAQVNAFFGQANSAQFSVEGGQVSYSGPHDWGYRRFILHYAHLCALAGGIDTFIIGSELRGLTQVRDGLGRFPAVDALIALAADVREILGPNVKISYAADWSEYFGYRPADGSGDIWFHLDDLWASADVDFVGIDNYMPLSDWRDSSDHLDASYKSIYDVSYLQSNVAGGEGFDWYYGSPEDRDAQTRTPIEDTAHGEHWVFRYKDLKSWWANPHHNRPGGARATSPTAWVPGSKPIVFTEFGCPAIDKGTNQPNVFVDEKSSENFVPYFSTGTRDDFIQFRYLQAHLIHWGRPENNPVSQIYGQPMVDMSRAYVWAFDTRPWPDFPSRRDVWSDGDNFGLGHWVSGRIGAVSLAAVVTQIAGRANFWDVDVSELHGSVRGYVVDAPQSARQSLQPLMLSFGFDCTEIGGKIVFRNRLGSVPKPIASDDIADVGNAEAVVFTRTPDLELTSQVELNFYQAENSYQIGAASATIPTRSEASTTSIELPVALEVSEGIGAASRFLSEAHVARDQVTFHLPPSALSLTVGDIISFEGDESGKIYRIDKMEDTGDRQCSAVRVEHGVYQKGGSVTPTVVAPNLSLSAPVHVEFLDLPLIVGDEVAHAPYIAASGRPWIGDQSVYVASSDSGYNLDQTISQSAIVGTTLNAFHRNDAGRWATSGTLMLRVPSGTLESRTKEDVLNGANIAALRRPGDADWEVFQFQKAELTGPGTYELSCFLRGQFGTDAIMPAVYPSGSDFVLLDGSLVQPNLPSSSRGLLRHYRVGPSLRPYDDASFQHFVAAFEGIGLRPYAPAHLRSKRMETGDFAFSWVRRARVDGDAWQSAEVPLDEEIESYLVRIRKDAEVVRETSVNSTQFIYDASAILDDTISAPFDFEVAQISAQFGPGPFKRITING